MPVPAWKRALSRALMSTVHGVDRLSARRLPELPLPTEDPFYLSDEELRDLPPGTLLGSRPIRPPSGPSVRCSTRSKI